MYPAWAQLLLFCVVPSLQFLHRIFQKLDFSFLREKIEFMMLIFTAEHIKVLCQAFLILFSIFSLLFYCISLSYLHSFFNLCSPRCVHINIVGRYNAVSIIIVFICRNGITQISFTPLCISEVFLIKTF